jgi:hypothetical protein
VPTASAPECRALSIDRHEYKSGMDSHIATSLRAACREVALVTMWDRRPAPEEQIEHVTREMFALAMHEAKYLDRLGDDPHFVVDALVYLRHAHAIPPMASNVAWLGDMLAALVQLRRPNTGLRPENAALLAGVAEGVQRSLAALRAAAEPPA